MLSEKEHEERLAGRDLFICKNYNCMDHKVNLSPRENACTHSYPHVKERACLMDGKQHDVKEQCPKCSSYFTRVNFIEKEDFNV